jgi:hypothetical protein
VKLEFSPKLDCPDVPFVSASPKPRSRTPTSLRTPRRHGYRQSVTPVGSLALHLRQPVSTPARLRPHIQRAASSGSTIDTGSPYYAGSGSARKWAKNAHLYEVRGKKAATPRKGEEERNGVKGIPRGRERGSREIVDVFGSGGGVGRDGPGKGIPLTTSGTRDRDLSPSFSPSDSVDDESGGDQWVDTDVDGSEVDSDSALWGPLEVTTTTKSRSKMLDYDR